MGSRVQKAETPRLQQIKVRFKSVVHQRLGAVVVGCPILCFGSYNYDRVMAGLFIIEFDLQNLDRVLALSFFSPSYRRYLLNVVLQKLQFLGVV